MVLTIGVSLFALGLLAWWVSAHLQKRSGLPVARVRYDDASGGHRPERPLVSHQYRLTGRPDYLLEQDGRLIPVELKPNRRAEKPYEGDLLQLAAYCLLVEEEWGATPPYGILRYASQSWEIPFDLSLRARLIQTLDAMTDAEQAEKVARSHQQPARCARCSQRAFCDQRLSG